MTDARIGDHLLTKTHQANEAIEGNRFVKPVSGEGFIVPHVVHCGDNGVTNGVNRDGVASGQLADIVKKGTAYVLTQEIVAAGLLVGCGTDGRAKVYTSGYTCGVSDSDANSGEFVKVILA